MHQTRVLKVVTSFLALALPAIAEAVFVPETPADIVGMRGMLPAIGICVGGLLLLCYVPAPGASEALPVEPPLSRRSDWLVLAVYILGVYATVPVGFQVVSFVVRRIGIESFRWSVNGVGLAAGILFLWHLIRRRHCRDWGAVVRLVAILTAYVYFFAVLEVPVKRIHFLEYSFLSWLLFRALRPLAGPERVYGWVPLAATAVGVGDEGLDLLFPRRFAAVSDVIWDATGGVLGALIVKFILRKR